MDCSTPDLPVPHHLRNFAQVHVHCITDAIQSSHTLMPYILLPSIFPSIRDFSNESPIESGDQNTGASASASVLPMDIHGLRPLRLTGLIPLLSRGLSAVFSNTTVQRHQFCGILPSLQSNSHTHICPLGRP